MEDTKSTRDIEESDEILEATEPYPIEFWVEKQRELITSVVDYNLGTLASLIESKAIDISPEYQRRFRWDVERQSRLIESFLMNVPVPPIFLNEDVYGKYSVIDGKQRLNTIYEFLRGRLHLKGLGVFSDINGLNFDDLPHKLQTIIKTRPTLRAVIILHQSDEDIKFDVFQRLNTGGVRLNPQEIRNSTYTGPLNDLILELSVNSQFHRLLGIKNKKKSVIYQEMRDAELVLRYFTFRDNWQNFTGGMKRHMDRYMSENRKMSSSEIEELKDDFFNTISIVEACFGTHPFQRWMPERNKWRKQVLASLFDAQMFACQGINAEKADPKQNQILIAFQQMFSDSEFRKAIDAATNTPSYFRTRIAMVQDMLNRTIY